MTIPSGNLCANRFFTFQSNYWVYAFLNGHTVAFLNDNYWVYAFLNGYYSCVLNLYTVTFDLFTVASFNDNTNWQSMCQSISLHSNPIIGFLCFFMAIPN
jgi:hypothetical protein